MLKAGPSAKDQRTEKRACRRAAAARFLQKRKRKRTGSLVLPVRFTGGDKRDRTADLLNAIQALSQLSYTPIGLKALENLDFQDI